jgi:hypothetical protein
LRNFIFEDISEIGISIKTQKNDDEKISSKSKLSMSSSEILLIMQLNRRNKIDESKYKCDMSPTYL